MRIQVLYLPTGAAAEHPRFALIIDKVASGENDVEVSDALYEFGRDVGATGVLVTDDTVEVYDPPLADTSEPEIKNVVTVTGATPPPWRTVDRRTFDREDLVNRVRSVDEVRSERPRWPSAS